MNTIESDLNVALDENEIFLYSAFHRYDEIFNLILAGLSIIGGIFGLVGTWCSSASISCAYSLYGSALAGGCFLGFCIGIFTSIITLMSGLPPTAFDSG